MGEAAEKFAGLPVDAPQRRRLPPLLRRAWYGLNQAFRRRIAHLGVTPDQFTVMRTLLEGERPGVTQQELTRRMSSDPNTVASLVRRMEAAKLIERRPDRKDRRANRLRLRPAGRRKYLAARAVALALQTEVLAVLPASQREPFLIMLHRVGEACKKAADASPRLEQR